MDAQNNAVYRPTTFMTFDTPCVSELAEEGVIGFSMITTLERSSFPN